MSRLLAALLLLLIALPAISPAVITTIVGTGTYSYSGDGGVATAATLKGPRGLAIDTSGNVYIADQDNHCIRKVTVSTGIISTIVGTGAASYSGDGGQAITATMNNPTGVALDTSGNIYIADYSNNRIRKVTISTNIIVTIAGTGIGTYSGDGAAASSAALYHPWGIALDSSGNVYIGDSANCRIRKITVSTGIITTIAGTGTASYSGDNGAATSATLLNPCGVTVDSIGNVYIADEYNNCIRKVTVSTGIISTIAGTGTSSYSGDNSAATAATLNGPFGVAFDPSSGNIYIADSFNNAVRKVTVLTVFVVTVVRRLLLQFHFHLG